MSDVEGESYASLPFLTNVDPFFQELAEGCWMNSVFDEGPDSKDMIKVPYFG